MEFMYEVTCAFLTNNDSYSNILQKITLLNQAMKDEMEKSPQLFGICDNSNSNYIKA